jgi:multiple antibiotic resistance protein|tara:strand:+ start:166 stop:744 length:579 start_codon:yes stop_codon:yes gene_type:complete
MNIDIKELISATMILFAVIDVIGNIPLILVLRQKFKIIESEKASIISLSIMILFLYLGEVLLNLLGVDIHSFAIAGSVIILFIAMEMILGIRIYRDDNPKTASIVPIAFPLIAGPGTLTTLISIKSEFEDINIILAIIINMILVYIVLKSSEKIEKILGIQGINVLRKIFGIILLAIGIKLFTTNIKLIFSL